MGHDVWLDSLRRAAGDPDALGRVLAEELPTDALQHIGDAVLSVLELPGTDLSDAVDRLVDRLRERHWDGDDELVDTLEHVIGRRPSPLPPLGAELAEVGEALSEQAGTENYLDLHTGTVWFHTLSDFGVADDLDVDLSDEARWLSLLREGSHEAYRDLQRFVGTVDDDDLAPRLSVAIEGRGAFGRFRSVRDPAGARIWRAHLAWLVTRVPISRTHLRGKAQRLDSLDEHRDDQLGRRSFTEADVDATPDCIRGHVLEARANTYEVVFDWKEVAGFWCVAQVPSSNITVIVEALRLSATTETIRPGSGRLRRRTVSPTAKRPALPRTYCSPTRLRAVGSPGVSSRRGPGNSTTCAGRSCVTSPHGSTMDQRT
jgi:hypothetical protein